MSTPLFDPIKAAAKLSDRVLVAFSGGKDSVATLDLCCRHFKEVKAFLMYYVRGLSFQEAMIRWVERRYGIEVLRVPHFELSFFFRYGVFRLADPDVPIISVREVYNYLRQQTGIRWIAAGERIKDSLVRRAMILNAGTIDRRRGRIYPLAYWSKADVLKYLRLHRLKYAPETRILGHSFRSLQPWEVWAVRQHYPKDFERIRQWFPLVGASVVRHERANQVSAG